MNQNFRCMCDIGTHCRLLVLDQGTVASFSCSMDRVRSIYAALQVNGNKVLYVQEVKNMFIEVEPAAIFFDVDGVLIDSVGLKGDAFALTFSDFPSEREQILAFHLEYGGVNRREKIERIFVEILGRAPSSKELNERLDLFTSIVVERVIAAPEIKGARKALDFWSTRVPLHAVSATPTAELFRILDARGLSKYFASAHGWPPDKSQTVKEVVVKNEYTPSRCTLIGDSREDALAAKLSGMPFVQVSPDLTTDFHDRGLIIRDLEGLTMAIELALQITNE